ncbi:DUF4921 family protein [Mobilicoccus sp.]|uniref:DUF4921 family protein n=1 Tax=Mobilicoccus sp. TaxID=2034349 RepID=UPI0028977CBD|nr:DUF4921 family protein [Mobilicoccus sp.]
MDDRPLDAAMRAPITVMRDGTVKQVNPLSGTEVWTVPGRANRPLVARGSGAVAEGPPGRGVPCAFCLDRLEEVPPEKARLIRADGGFRTLTALPPEELRTTTPEFRRLPNLFEIVSFDYWRGNHGHEPGAAAHAHHEAWLASPLGRGILADLLRARDRAGGCADPAAGERPAPEREARSLAFFAGGHDLIVPRRHLTEDGQLAAAGSLTPAAHAAYIRFTVQTLGHLYAEIPAARYVATFQNWLAPAGASFDHLHKQLVAIDEHGDQVGRELTRLAGRPHLYADHLAYARRQGLVLAENAHAVAFAGFGHRYPTLEVWAKDTTARPFEMTVAQVDGVSDLVHAMHLATGAEIPSNEEWHHRPIDVDQPMPWRVELKWRVSTLAGFEGGTRIFVTTITPWDLRDRALDALRPLTAAGALGPSVELP